MRRITDPYKIAVAVLAGLALVFAVGLAARAGGKDYCEWKPEKCETTTTTTPTTTTTEATTTTIEPTTTTTTPESSSTTTPPTTTTLPGGTTTSVPLASTTTLGPTSTTAVSAEWTAEAVCNPPGIFIDFDPAAMAVEGWFYVAGLPNKADGWENTFTAYTPGVYETGQTDFTQRFRLVAVPVDGVSAHPAEIYVQVPGCPATPDTPDSSTPVAELPFTGVETPILAVSALILLASGGYLVRKARDV